MAVFRIERTRDYTVMSNHHLRNANLSLKAKGLLSMMLSLPEDWNYTTRGLAKICKEGVDAIGAALRELERAGYIVRYQKRDKNGRITDTEYVIYEQPQPGTPQPDMASPDTENPDMVKPDTEKPAELNIEKSNTEKTITYDINMELNIHELDTSKVRRHIIKELGDMRMADVTLDDIQLALVPVSKKSASVYKSVVVLYKSIFRAAKESRIIENNPTVYLTSKGGGVPQKEKEALTDEQAARLLDAIQGLPPYVFVMLGLYAGLRREEILALQWDSVYLDTDTPYLTVRRAWHTESNRPVILDELKTKAAERNIPLPICLADCLREAKANSTSEYVVPNRDGDPLSYTQFKRLWQYIVTRTTKERVYYRYEDGKRVQHTVTPVLGEKAAHNGKVVYSLDFEVTPHQLRHTYITNLIHSSVDPKTVQYLAGHESSKITMDIYAKVKYNRPDELVKSMGGAFAQWDGVRS